MKNLISFVILVFVLLLGSSQTFGTYVYKSANSSTREPVRGIDTSSTSLPSTASPIDGLTPVTGDRFLFTNLSSNNNKVYKANVGSGTVNFANYPINTGSTRRTFTGTVFRWSVSFVAPSTTTVTSVQWALERLGTPGGNVFITIWSNSGGLPNALIGTSDNLATSSVPLSAALTSFNFSTPVNVSSGVTYHAVINVDGGYTYSAGVNSVSSLDATGSPIGGVSNSFYNGTWSSYPQTESAVISGLGTVATWTAETDGPNQGTATAGSELLVRLGTSNAKTKWFFDGTNWTNHQFKSILPIPDNTLSLGSATNRWGFGYISGLYDATSNLSIAPSGRNLFNGGNVVMDWSAKTLGSATQSWTTNSSTMNLNGSSSGVLSITAPATITTHTLTLPSAQGGASTVLTNNGSGALSWASPTGANTTLSNLTSPTSINQNLLPSTDNSFTLGSSAAKFSSSNVVSSKIYASAAVDAIQRQATTQTSQQYSSSLTTARAGATIAVPAGGFVNKVVFSLCRQGTVNGTATISIYNTSGGLPTGSSVATSNTVNASSIPACFSPAPVTFTFASPFTLAPSTYYGYILNYANFTGGGTVYIYGAGANIDGNANTVWDNSGGGTWSTDVSDIYFQLINSTNPATTIVAGSQTADINWTLPTAQGAASTILANDGTGVLSWSSPLAGGATTNIQYNNGGLLAGSSNLVWDNTNGRLGLGATPTISRLFISGSAALNQPDISFVNTETLGGTYRVGMNVGGSDPKSFNLYDVTATALRFRVQGDGIILIPNLAGTGTRPINTDSSGHLVPGTYTRTINAQTGTTYTFALTDGSANATNPFVTFGSASATVVTVPPNSSVAFPVGTVIEASRVGAGTVTFAAGVGVTINSAAGSLAISAQYGAVSLIKTATDTWLLFGSI